MGGGHLGKKMADAQNFFSKSFAPWPLNEYKKPENDIPKHLAAVTNAKSEGKKKKKKKKKNSDET